MGDSSNLIAILILGSNDHKINIIEISIFLFFYFLIMFYRKGRTAGYISVLYIIIIFDWTFFLFDHFVYIFKVKFQSSQLQSYFWERHAE